MALHRPVNMIIGILQADPVLPELRSQFGDYPTMFQELLSGVSLDLVLDFKTYDVEKGQYPDCIDDCSAYLITGSRASAYDDEEWIRNLETFVCHCHEARKPLIGICFGHQVIAKALGGAVRQAPQGWGVGVHTVRILADKGFMAPSLQEISLLVSHRDQVMSLPPGAELLASSDFCPIAMYQIGEHILAQQSHPEFCSGYSQALMDIRREIIGEDIYQRGSKSLVRDTHGNIAAQWILNFMAQGAAGRDDP